MVTLRLRTALLALTPLLGCGGTHEEPPKASTGPTYVGSPNAPDLVQTSTGQTAQSPTGSRFFLSSVELDVPPEVSSRLQSAPTSSQLARRIAVHFEAEDPSPEVRLRFPNVVADKAPGSWLIPTFQETRQAAGSPLPIDASFVIDFEEPSVVEAFGAIEPDARTAHGIEAFVSEYISTKTYTHGFDIASRVASLKAGDCTEHAVLLAALLRKAKIPARVVFGVVIALTPQGSFAAGHAWVEYAKRGSWQRLDAALYGAAHPEPPPQKRQIGVPGLDDMAEAAPRPPLWLYLTTDVLTEEGPGYSRFLASHALRGLVTRVRLQLTTP